MKRPQLAFELGPVQGMTPKDIGDYIRYVADWRLTQLRLPGLYGHFEKTETGPRQIKPHPLP